MFKATKACNQKSCDLQCYKRTILDRKESTQVAGCREWKGDFAISNTVVTNRRSTQRGCSADARHC